MTTAISSNYLSPGAQIQQFCSSIASLIGSVAESTDSAFKRVNVTKRDANGSTRLYNASETVIDQHTGVSTVVMRQVSELTYIEDVKTGELYVDESACSIATKCSLIALVLPIFTLGKMGWHVAKTPLEIGSIAISAISNIGQLFAAGSLWEAAKEAQCEIFHIFEVLSNSLFEVVKAPLFALGCEFVAIYGIFKPYHGRKFEALIENAWQQGASQKLDFRNIPARPGESCLTAFFKDVLEPRPFYLAHCFQVRGNTRDSLITVTARNPL